MYAEFQDIGKVPWQLLIRARTAAELDAVIATTVVSAISEVGSRGLTQRVAKAAIAGVSKSQTPAEPTSRTAVIDAAADFDERCGNGLRWPPRPRHIVDELGDPAVYTVLTAARELVKAGSDELQEALGSALNGAREV